MKAILEKDPRPLLHVCVCGRLCRDQAMSLLDVSDETTLIDSVWVHASFGCT